MVKNIIALIDFSQLTDKIVDKAGELAKLYGAKCWMIHVATPNPDFVGYEAGPQYIRDSRAEVLLDEHRVLHEFKVKLEEKGIAAEALLVQGQINATIDYEMAKLKADMVILGSHGHNRLYNLLVGSVCEHMLTHCTIPMVIIPGEHRK